MLSHQEFQFNDSVSICMGPAIRLPSLTHTFSFSSLSAPVFTHFSWCSTFHGVLLFGFPVILISRDLCVVSVNNSGWVQRAIRYGHYVRGCRLMAV